VESAWEGPQHIGTDLETRDTDARPDGGDEVLRAASVAQESSGANPGQTGKGSTPTAMGQDGAGPDRIRNHHGEAVGVTNQSRIARLK
jgi:hypothetical protein